MRRLSFLLGEAISLQLGVCLFSLNFIDLIVPTPSFIPSPYLLNFGKCAGPPPFLRHSRVNYSSCFMKKMCNDIYVRSDTRVNVDRPIYLYEIRDPLPLEAYTDTIGALLRNVVESLLFEIESYALDTLVYL